MKCSFEGCMTSLSAVVDSIPRDGNVILHCNVNGVLQEHDSSSCKWNRRELHDLAIKELSSGKGPTEACEDLMLKYGEDAPSIDVIKKLNCRKGLSGLPNELIQQLYEC